MVNDKIATGTIEIEMQEHKVISVSKALPMPIDTDGYEIDEEIRAQYRYLDLRRPRMAQNIKVRNKVVKYIRDFLSEKYFTEIDTPILTKTSPEGARDFIVPSRLQPGKFYALPQSPQQYKQLLMVAGFERYFQIARCFRDEDPRKDRAYGEFSQLDIEMSFVEQNDILELIEELFTNLIKELFPEKHITQSPWPRISHKEAKEKYGNDKPDLRKNPDDPHELAFAWVLDFPLFTEQSDEDFYHGSGNAKYAAFTYGVPPHGGIAPGIDRFLMAMLGEPSVREVIPFPASASGKTAVMHAPSVVEKDQLKELGLHA
jgi:aspartyl-tRNA synthetase